MFFHRNNRIKTESKIVDRFEDTFIQNKRRLKIKNIRFSIGQQYDKIQFLEELSRQNEQVPSQIEAEVNIQQKKLNFLSKLPEINFENRQVPKQVSKQIKNNSTQNKKKDILLTSILDILKPNSHLNSNTNLGEKQFGQPRLAKDWKLETQVKQYTNEFSEELPHYNSTKHYRAPKILENQLMKYKNSNNIVRRKIVSEHKDRQKIEGVLNDKKKSDVDLQKIEILTFANKFPIFKKDGLSLK